MIAKRDESLVNTVSDREGESKTKPWVVMWTIAVQAQYNSSVINAHTLRDFILKSENILKARQYFSLMKK